MTTPCQTVGPQSKFGRRGVRFAASCSVPATWPPGVHAESKQSNEANSVNANPMMYFANPMPPARTHAGFGGSRFRRFRPLQPLPSRSRPTFSACRLWLDARCPVHAEIRNLEEWGFQTVPRSKTGTNYRFTAVSAGFQLAKVVGFVHNLNFSACEFQAPAPDWLSATPSQKQRPKFQNHKSRQKDVGGPCFGELPCR